MSQELVNSVNKLTDETSALLQEYVKGNTVLQNSASDAASSAAAAKASETNSVNQANIATQKAAEAKISEQNAAAIVTGGTATIDPLPGKIPLANSQGKISSGWLTALAFARTKADMDAMRASVNRQCAASGMIHAGKHLDSSNWGPINEGMFAIKAISASASANLIYLGRVASASGSSDTNEAMFNIAGFPVSLIGVNTASTKQASIKFPQAPDGTDIYDSSGNCRGTGKPTLNLLTEVDPKYGDVAPNVNEAVARAFEGAAKNADLRNGLDGWSKSSGTTLSDIGNKVIGVEGDSVWGSARANQVLKAGVKYEISFELLDTGEVVGAGISSYGGITDLQPSTSSSNTYFYPYIAGSYVCTFTATEGAYISLIVKDALKVAHFRLNYIRPITEEVVTERVDLSGLEGYLEEITPAKPYIYPYGGINNQATSVDGIATTVDNVRPITYFANFDGDTTSRGRGWNLNDLTDAQLLTILQNPYHHVYVIDGKLVQFRVRPRTIAGAGNGDWIGVDSTNGGILAFSINGPVLRVIPQGLLDTAPKVGTSSFYYYATGHYNNWNKVRGAYTCTSTGGDPVEGVAADGECYFYVLATVLRLNKGAYHPSFNPLGSGRFHDKTGDINNGWLWYGSSAYAPSSRAECFKFVTANSGNGSISGNNSGRPDGKFYDAIYPDGVGGVIDRRLSAFPVTMEDYFKAIAKAENGTMRGMEKLVWTKVGTVTHTGNAVYSDGYTKLVAAGQVWSAEFSDWYGFAISAGDASLPNSYIIASDGSVYPLGVITPLALGGVCYISREAGNVVSKFPAGTYHVVVSRDIGPSVSGNFLQTDVSGHPANILQVEALKDGWLGSWIPQIPDGTSKKYLVTRKALSDPTGLLSNNFGSTWGSFTPSFSSGTNDFTFTTTSGVLILNYTAASKVTKPSAALPVYGGRAGLGDVLATMSRSLQSGVLLTESILGKAGNYVSVGKTVQKISITQYFLSSDGKISSDSTYGQLPSHLPISLATNQASPTQVAIKILPHAASRNGQATLGFVWNELKHDGTSWNDDGQMRVIDGIGTYNNLNGQSCLYGYAELALPIGWVDNHARFGAQVPGVDL
ncbi:hypothetical protein [Vibrio navarrensis]|uniref:Uncharacterized protein n=1 Tax=Vibrio navarrensis TaxID=29495 RepID=A0AAJ4LTE5_9VIBR|nr:hypothetical protein I3X05_10270 [Vibrio navarrensis]